MNMKTYNYLASNINPADIYGRRTTGLGTFEGIGQINELFTRDDLPNFVVYDEGYQTAANPGNLNAVMLSPVWATGKKASSCLPGRCCRMADRRI